MLVCVRACAWIERKRERKRKEKRERKKEGQEERERACGRDRE
jgi:hypothetical protein